MPNQAPPETREANQTPRSYSRSKQTSYAHIHQFRKSCKQIELNSPSVPVDRQGLSLLLARVNPKWDRCK